MTRMAVSGLRRFGSISPSSAKGLNVSAAASACGGSFQSSVAAGASDLSAGGVPGAAIGSPGGASVLAFDHRFFVRPLFGFRAAARLDQGRLG